MTEPQTAAPTCTKPAAKNLYLPCPECGEKESAISLRLDLIGEEEDDTFTCGNCEATFSVATVRSLIKKWSRVLAWLDLSPDLDEE